MPVSPSPQRLLFYTVTCIEEVALKGVGGMEVTACLHGRQGKEEQGNGVSRRKDTVKELRSRCRALWRRADEHEVERPVAYVCTADRLAAALRGRASAVLETDFD